MKMNELMIYQVFPLRALTDGQPSHGILEMIDWIPHIKKLGMNAVYFSPVFSSSDHGYDTKDYQKIDERLGTNEDFKKMCDAMHEEGIQVILDGVFNHVGREFFAFEDVREKKWDSPYKDWFYINFEEVKRWYDGYLLKDYQVYNPRAVISLMQKGEFKSYWSETASYEAIVPLINMDYDGLKTAIIEMLSGAAVKVNTATFKNDILNIQSKDDVLTYMIHLGYLGYDQTRKMAFVPNEEIRQELTIAVESKAWSEMLGFWKESENLLDATLNMDEDTVARQLEKIHGEYVSIIQYHNENSLSSVLTIAYLSTMQYYFKPIRELPAGRGFADFVFLPKPEYRGDYPALVVELKWNKKVQTAMQQIKERKYPLSILNYTGNILLVGINYDKDNKEHQCLIEKYEKEE